MKQFIQFAAAFLFLAVPATVAAQTYDTNPTMAFSYGTGNGYLPANAAVISNGTELALRAHVPGQAAASTGGTGVYTFDLGSAVSFDFSIFGSDVGTSLTLTNLLTGDTAYFNPLTPGISSLQSSGAVQGSQQLGFSFLNGGFGGLFGDLNFDANINNTYRIDLTGGGNEILSVFAQVGSGAVVAAVPEPGTWAMMLLGFGAMGVALRRRRQTHNSLQAA